MRGVLSRREWSIRLVRGRGAAAPVAALGIALGVAAAASASERRFTYVYEASVQAPGALEYEQWITWKTRTHDDPEFDRFDFRHELEIGLTERLQLGLYLSDWRYQDGRSVSDDGADWRNIAVETIYLLADPVEEPLGLALYGEIKLGDELLALEAKLIAQHNVGKWIIAWNGTAEAEWEGSDYSEDKAEFEQTLGASYQFSPRFLVGAELLHEIEYDDWSEWGDHAVYIGPNVGVRTEAWWLTVTGLFQVTSVDEEPDFQTRLILGFDF